MVMKNISIALLLAGFAAGVCAQSGPMQGGGQNMNSGNQGGGQGGGQHQGPQRLRRQIGHRCVRNLGQCAAPWCAQFCGTCMVLC